MSSRDSDKEGKTIEYYDRVSASWVPQHATSRYWSSLDTFFNSLPKGRLLEIGCGGARDAKDYLVDRYDYVGTDASQGMLDEAKKVVPKGVFMHQSFYELNFPEDSFDGFWASASLLHVPKARIDEVLQLIGTVVKSGGIGFISMKQGVGEEADEDARWFAYYSQDEFKAILERNKFEVIEATIRPTEGKTTWMLFVVRSEK